jgi:hypothetical protein
MHKRIAVCLLFAGSALAQVTYVLSPVAHQQFLSPTGQPLAGGRLWTYAAGTTTPQSTFADNIGTLNPNPLTLDSGGFTPNGLYLDASKSYKFMVTNGLGSTMWTQDNINVSGGGAGTAINLSSPPPIGDVTPNTIQGTVVTATNRFSGPLIGNVTGNLNGNVTGSVTGNVTGNVTGSAGSVSLSGLTSATSSPTALTNGNYGQYWQWQLTGGSPEAGLGITESAASTNTATLSALLSSTTLSGSTVPPFQALAAGANGLRVNSSGNIVAVGSGNFVGPLTGNVTGTASNASALAGFQSGHFGPTCVTASTTYAICTTTYNFSSATPTSLPGYADTGYRITCNLTGTLTSLPMMYGVGAVSGSQFNLSIILANGSTAASAPGVDCMFYHP